MRVFWRAGTLFGIFRCLYLRYRRTRDAYFHLVGDFQNYRVAVDSIDGSVDACRGDDLVAVFDCCQHFRHFLALPLLRHDHQEIHDAEHEYQRYQEAAKPGTPGLPKKECCQIHVRYLLPYPFGATTSLTENKKARHISGPREKNPRAGAFPAYTARPILVLRLGLPRVATAPLTTYFRRGLLASGRPRRIARVQLWREFREMSKADSLSDLPHYVNIKVDIVMGRQNRRSDFSSCKQMPNVRPRIPLTYAARAIWIDRFLILAVTRVLYQHASHTSIQARMSRCSCRQHAIHHVDATRHIICKLLRPAHSHQIARLLRRQKRCYFHGHLASHVMGLANCQSTHRVSGESQFQKLSRTLAPQIRKRRALHNSKLPLCQVSVTVGVVQKILPRSSRPRCGPLQSSLCHFSRRRRLDAFIQHHRNVRAQRQLDFGRLLWRQ